MSRQFLPTHLQKVSMHAVVLCYLRMEGKPELFFISDCYDITVYTGQYLYCIFCLFNIGGTDKGKRKLLPDLFHISGALKAAKLSAISIPLYSDRKRAKVHGRIIRNMLCQKDQSRTGCHNGQSRSDLLLQRYKQSKLP